MNNLETNWVCLDLHIHIAGDRELDEYITADNPVRFIDAFVDALDLQQLGFTRARPSALGRTHE